jgi:hypothetical protein
VRQIGGSVFTRRRADGDEDDVGVIHGLFVAGREVQPPGLDRVLDDCFESRLVNRQFAALQLLDLAWD